MSQFQEIYQSKLISKRDLAGLIEPGFVVALGGFGAQPSGAIGAIGEFARDVDPLYIMSSYALEPWGLRDHPGMTILSGFHGPLERALCRERDNIFYTPIQFTDARKWTQEGVHPDFFMVRVAPMDERGNFNFSMHCSWEYRAILWLDENSPNTRIVFEVNSKLPRVFGIEEFGNNEMPVSIPDLIIEDDSPLSEFPTPAPSETEEAIAGHVAKLIEDRATIQLGIGTIPMAIGHLIADRRELGIHTEMFCEAHVDLIEAGSVTNSHKGLHDGLSVAAFALGGKRLHEWIAENPEFALAPVEEVNSTPVLARVNRMTSINSVLTVDLSGQACAHCLGPKTYSGLGGAFEFAYGSQLSAGGKSVVCLPSTTTLGDGREVSNIVAYHPLGTRITIPEHCIDWVVTEFGGVRLKLLNMEQRAQALIGIAHPKFREAMEREAGEMGLRLSRIPNLPAPPAPHKV